MSRRVVADVADAGLWPASTPAGEPSTELSVVVDPTGWSGAPAMTLAVNAGAEGHRVAHALAAPVDVSGFDDLELWVRGTRIADGSPASPLYMELRLGSAALEIGAVANPWHRLIPLSQTGAWQPVTIGLQDLPAEVRGAVAQLRLTCVEASEAFSLQLGAVGVRAAELLLDVDAALVRRLGSGLTVDGRPVEVIVDPATAPQAPFLRLRNYAVRPAEERSPSGGTRTDYTTRGFSIRPPAVAVDLFYAIEPVAPDRARAAAMFQHAFAELAPRATLDIEGRRVAVDWVEGPALEFDDISAQPALHVRVATAKRAIAAAAPGVLPFNDVNVEVDGRAIA